MYNKIVQTESAVVIRTTVVAHVVHKKNSVEALGNRKIIV